MCRNIKTLFNFDPTASDEETRAAALQFVRKISRTTTPSMANEVAFDQAVDAINLVVRRLLDALFTSAPPKNREEKSVKASARATHSFSE